MRPCSLGRALATAGAALLIVGGADALGASRTVTVEGWSQRVLAFSGDRLLWSEAAKVVVDPARIGGSPPGAQRFDYYRAEVFRAPLNRTATRFTGTVDTPVSVRTSIAAMGPGVLSPTGDGGFVVVPESRRFAPPVIVCCTPDDTETVIESDGRAGAPNTIAAAWAGDSVRFLQISGGGPHRLRIVDTTGATPPIAREGVGATAPRLAALSPTAIGWVDPAAPTTFVLQGDGGAPVSVALPGRALRVWASSRVFAVAARVGRRVVLLRVDESATPRVRRVWSGARMPRVALGGGRIAVGERRRVLASRRGAVRVVTRTRRVVDAVGIDGRRLAWVERGKRRGVRVGVVRLARIR